MRLLLSLLCFCLASQAACVQAANRPDVEIRLSQQLDHDCDGLPETDNAAAPGDCILYRIEVENTGTETARNIKIQARIPEHTRLKNPLERLPGTEPAVDSEIEQNENGIHLIKTRLEELAPGKTNQVILIYVVQTL